MKRPPTTPTHIAKLPAVRHTRSGARTPIEKRARTTTTLPRSLVGATAMPKAPPPALSREFKSGITDDVSVPITTNCKLARVSSFIELARLIPRTPSFTELHLLSPVYPVSPVYPPRLLRTPSPCAFLLPAAAPPAPARAQRVATRS
jgi:hypothetical protein